MLRPARPVKSRNGGVIRWQRGHVLGKGRSGTVYLGLNLDKCAFRCGPLRERLPGPPTILDPWHPASAPLIPPSVHFLSF